MAAVSKLDKLKNKYRAEFDIDAPNKHEHKMGRFPTYDDCGNGTGWMEFLDIADPLDASTLAGFVNAILYIRDCTYAEHKRRYRQDDDDEDCDVDCYEERLNSFLNRNGLHELACKLEAADELEEATEAAEAATAKLKAVKLAQAQAKAQTRRPAALVKAAIQALDGGKKGSSLHAIKKHVEEKADGECTPKQVLAAIKQLLAKGALVKVKSSFKLRVSDKPVTKAAGKAKTKVPAAVKAGGKKTAGKTNKATAAPKGQRPEVIDGEEHFVVASFEAVRLEQRDGEQIRRFKVRWQGYGPGSDSWVSERGLKADLDKRTFARLAAGLNKQGK